MTDIGLDDLRNMSLILHTGSPSFLARSTQIYNYRSLDKDYGTPCNQHLIPNFDSSGLDELRNLSGCLKLRTDCFNDHMPWGYNGLFKKAGKEVNVNLVVDYDDHILAIFHINQLRVSTL